MLLIGRVSKFAPVSGFSGVSWSFPRSSIPFEGGSRNPERGQVEGRSEADGGIAASQKRIRAFRERN